MITLKPQSKIMKCDETLQVSRDVGTKNFSDGKVVDVSKVIEFPAKGNVQPLNGRDLLMVPEGDRFKEQYYVFSHTPLLVEDTITRNGITFEVQSSEDWGSFCRVRMVRIDVGPKANP